LAARTRPAFLLQGPVLDVGGYVTVITEPEPVIAPVPIRTGATRALLEPMNAPSPTWVSNFSKPS
jgi:hypothetical protein